MTSKIRDHALLAILSLGAACPFVYLLVMLSRYYLDVPYMDEWAFPIYFQSSYEGTLSLHDLWQQVNEHRLLIPNLVAVVLGRLTHWNLAYETALTVSFAVGLFGLVMWHMRTLARCLHTSLTAWTLPVVSLLIFSLSQWQNWFMGMQFLMTMNVLAAAGGFVLVAQPSGGVLRFAGALFLGFVASYSNAAGLSFWPIGFVVLALTFGWRTRTAQLRWGAWLFVGGLTLFSFFYGYKNPSYRPSPWLITNQPLDFVRYVLTFLGGPIVGYNNVAAALAGALGLLLFCGAYLRLTLAHAVPARDLAVPISLMLYGVANGLLTAAGRLNFGPDQAMSSRYVTMGNLLWIALAMLLCVVVSKELGERWTWVRAGTVVCMIGLFLMLVSANSLYGTLKWTERYRYKLAARQELISGNDPALLERLHPDPNLVLNRREILKKYHLNVFRQ